MLKKSYEIAYAVFRIAANLPDADFAGKLKNAATALLGFAAGQNYESAINELAPLEYLVRLAMDVNMIGIANGEILLKEVYGLKVTLEAEMRDAAKTEEVDIAGIFSKEDFESGNLKTGKHREETIRQDFFEPEVVQSGSEVESGNDAESGNGMNVILKSAIRQSAILERIRQSGNCRIKDIQEILPGSSERTIRYDLQTLVEQNLIERVGSGGPSVYYRVRQIDGVGVPADGKG